MSLTWAAERFTATLTPSPQVIAQRVCAIKLLHPAVVLGQSPLPP